MEKTLLYIKKVKHPYLLALGVVLLFPLSWFFFLIIFPSGEMIVIGLAYIIPFIASFIATYGSGKYSYGFSFLLIFPLLLVLGNYLFEYFGYPVDLSGFLGAVLAFIGGLFTASLSVPIGTVLGKHWNEKTAIKCG